MCQWQNMQELFESQKPTFFIVIGIHGDKDVLDDELQHKDVDDKGTCPIDC